MPTHVKNFGAVVLLQLPKLIGTMRRSVVEERHVAAYKLLQVLHRQAFIV